MWCEMQMIWLKTFLKSLKISKTRAKKVIYFGGVMENGCIRGELGYGTGG